MSEEKQVREIIADTETTGLSISDGNRIIELGLIEVINNKRTGREIYYLINPEGQPIEPKAYEIHKIEASSLKDKPTFRDIVDEVEEFVKDAKFVAHNAYFDADYLDMEFKKAGKPSFYDTISGVVDTLKIAKQLLPGKAKSLDALVKTYNIDGESRADRHGALIDASLLVDVYDELKKKISVDVPNYESDIPRRPIKRIDLKGFKPALIEVSEQDQVLHEKIVDSLNNPVERKVEVEQKVAPVSPKKSSFF